VPASVEGDRRRFAADLRARAGLTSDALVDAFGRVPRERFLGPGPWMIRGGRDRAPRATLDADPRQVYQDVSVAVDLARDLYNGQPSTIAGWLETLAIRPGDHVLHIGCGTGYYTAVIAELAGSTGQVAAIEVDDELAGRAAAALAPWPWASVRRGDGRSGLPEVDVLLVHAGATHILDAWLDAVRDAGRLLVPLTCTLPGMPASLSKGIVVTAARQGGDWSARAGSLVMIYALAAARDDAMNARLGRALMSGRAPAIRRIRRDPHDLSPGCWLHGASCLATE
jgi:protein-L-isoaspartate(D-aspartate) O-methyltransferase